MKTLGEQWIVEIEGVRHMVKLCQSNPKEVGTCSGCIHHSWNEGDWCDVAPLKACVEFGYIIKDLGTVNDEGLLSSPWYKGLFPQIVHEVNSKRINPQAGEEEIIKDLWYVVLEGNPLICTDEFFTKQEAIDAWNRRV